MNRVIDIPINYLNVPAKDFSYYAKNIRKTMVLNVELNWIKFFTRVKFTEADLLIWKVMRV